MIYIFMKFSIDCPIQSLQAHVSLYKFYLSAIKAGPRGYAPMIINEEGNRKTNFGVAWYERRVKMTHEKKMAEGV